MNNKQMKQIAERVLQGMKANSDVGRWCIGVLMDAGVVEWCEKEHKYVERLNVSICENIFGWHADVYINERKVGGVHYSTSNTTELEIDEGLTERETSAILSKCEEYYGKEFKEKE